MKKHNQVLKQLEKERAADLLDEHGLLCKQMPFGKDCNPLYFGKPHWTNRFDKNRDSTIGIFAAIWVSPELMEHNQFAYNIHSKAIRKLTDYQLTSIEFAQDFRERVVTEVADWPNIRLDYGPTNLLEGRGDSDLDNFAENAGRVLQGFVDIHHHIDSLLEASLK